MTPAVQIMTMTSRRKILKLCSMILFAFLLLTIGVLHAPGQTQNVKGSQSNESRILLTAIDPDGRFVSSLRVEDLRVLVDGVPQKIEEFERVTDRTLSVAILVDTSASQERTLPGQKLAASSFLDSVARPGTDRVAVATFTGTLIIEQTLTSDVTLLHKAIERAQFLPPPGYVRGGLIIGPPPPLKRTPAALASQTAVWDAVINTCNDVLSQSAGESRLAIIVLTDGQDTISQNKMAAAVARAVSDSVAVYAIGIGDPDVDGVDKNALRKLSERTGGRAFFPRTIGDLKNIFAEIGQELRRPYAISYSQSNGRNGPGKIKIELVNPDLRKADVQLYYQQVVPRK